MGWLALGEIAFGIFTNVEVPTNIKTLATKPLVKEIIR